MSAVEVGDPISLPCGCQQSNAARVSVDDPLQMQRHIHGVECSQPQDAHDEGEHSEVCPASKRRLVMLSILTALVNVKSGTCVVQSAGCKAKGTRAYILLVLMTCWT